MLGGKNDFGFFWVFISGRRGTTRSIGNVVIDQSKNTYKNYSIWQQMRSSIVRLVTGTNIIIVRSWRTAATDAVTAAAALLIPIR